MKDATQPYERPILEALRKAFRHPRSAGFHKSSIRPNIQNALGTYYGKGLGVETNLVESYAWYALSGKPYGEHGKTRMKLEQQMSPQQIAAGKKRAEELRAQIAAKSKSGSK